MLSLHSVMSFPCACMQAGGRSYGATRQSNLGTHGQAGSLITPSNTHTYTSTHSSGPPSTGGGARVAYRKNGGPYSSNFDAEDPLIENDEISRAEGSI